MKVLGRLIAFTAGFAVLPSQATTVASDLVGCYVNATDSGRERILLDLRQDKTYVALTSASLGIWAKASGQWHISDGAVLLGEPNEARGWHYYMQPIRVSSSNRGVTLTAGGDVLVARPNGCGL
ncbi:hypothetical protein J2X06_000007 [Lysobacter niastensis]|uniref:C-type lysozyme inhibitor domain-containing protein n=1 Tax=Lysobacter niastensis TaxID=380629 RepID=A0ABU1W5G3_9GAMM|nr:hypothetical protein [Lysobacter niastensis]MDR7132823.1 hypothetical protein [Lysobacter niastensis]